MSTKNKIIISVSALCLVAVVAVVAIVAVFAASNATVTGNVTVSYEATDAVFTLDSNLYSGNNDSTGQQFTEQLQVNARNSSVSHDLTIKDNLNTLEFKKDTLEVFVFEFKIKNDGSKTFTAALKADDTTTAEDDNVNLYVLGSPQNYQTQITIDGDSSTWTSKISQQQTNAELVSNITVNEDETIYVYVLVQLANAGRNVEKTYSFTWTFAATPSE